MSFDNITVVINTFHSQDIINECLDSIDLNLKVIIIENSDNINFKADLENKYSNVNCYLTGDNLGYAKGNNLGISKVKTEYALILNPDAKLRKDTIKNFLITAKKIKNFSIIGPADQDEFSSIKKHKFQEDVFKSIT